MLHFMFLLHQSAPLFFVLHQYAIAPLNKPPTLLRNKEKQKDRDKCISNNTLHTHQFYKIMSRVVAGVHYKSNLQLINF